MAKIAEYNAPVEKLRPSDAGYSASETAARQIRVSYNEAGTADREVGTLANDLARTIAQEQREAGASRVRGLEGGGGRVGVTKNYFGGGRDTASGFNRLTGIAAGLAGNSETDVYPDSAFAQYASKADAMYSNTAIGQPGYKGPNPTMSYDEQLKQEMADPNNPMYSPGPQSYAKIQQQSYEQTLMQNSGVQGLPGENAKVMIQRPGEAPTLVPANDPDALKFGVGAVAPANAATGNLVNPPALNALATGGADTTGATAPQPQTDNAPPPAAYGDQ